MPIEKLNILYLTKNYPLNDLGRSGCLKNFIIICISIQLCNLFYRGLLTIMEVLIAFLFFKGSIRLESGSYSD